MSEHLASMNEQITSQNDKIDKLQQHLHITNSKVNREFCCQLDYLIDIGWKKRKKIKMKIIVLLLWQQNANYYDDSHFSRLISFSFIVLFLNLSIHFFECQNVFFSIYILIIFIHICNRVYVSYRQCRS